MIQNSVRRRRLSYTSARQAAVQRMMGGLFVCLFDFYVMLNKNDWRHSTLLYSGWPPHTNRWSAVPPIVDFGIWLLTDIFRTWSQPKSQLGSQLGSTPTLAIIPPHTRYKYFSRLHILDQGGRPATQWLQVRRVWRWSSMAQLSTRIETVHQSATDQSHQELHEQIFVSVWEKRRCELAHRIF